MEETFFIDSYSGINTFITVEDGIIKSIDSNLNPKISTEYVGKTISFMKEDFEKRMKPSWHSVKSLKWSLFILKPLSYFNSQKEQAYNRKMSMISKGVNYKVAEGILKKTLEDINKKEAYIIKEARELKTQLETIHNFIVNFK